MELLVVSGGTASFLSSELDLEEQLLALEPDAVRQSDPQGHSQFEVVASVSPRWLQRNHSYDLTAWSDVILQLSVLWTQWVQLKCTKTLIHCCAITSHYPHLLGLLILTDPSRTEQKVSDFQTEKWILGLETVEECLINLWKLFRSVPPWEVKLGNLSFVNFHGYYRNFVTVSPIK